MMKRLIIVLVFISQFCFAQNYTRYLTGSDINVNTNHESGICLMGGATEHDEAMRWFLRKADGGDVVVLRASGSNGYNNYFYSELGITINSVNTFVIHNQNGAIDPLVLQKVADAEAIWFAGGNQYNYVSYFKDNALEDVLNDFINVKQGVIGGTSAGMAILGNYYFSAQNGTVTNAQALANPYHNRVTLGYNDFLEIPFLESVVTDTHYDDPDRRGRHSVFLARFAQDNGMRPFGIACNEFTAVCVEPDGKAYVYGDYPNYEEHAFFLQSNCAPDYAPENCTSGNPLNWNRNGEAIKVYKVPGTNTGENYFDISDWQTGSGGTWQDWHVNNGTFLTSASINPNCALSINDKELLLVEVFPNPFLDFITISSEIIDLEIQLFDVFGKKVIIDNVDNKIETSQLASGIYFLKVTSDDFISTFKIIKN